MKIAIISDVHGNLEAFKEVLKDIDHQHIDDIVCLGDNIGYGPEPEEVVNLVRGRKMPCVMGNHELVFVQPQILKKMNPTPRKSAALTQELISPETIEYITTLKHALVFQGARCVHGCPPDSPTTYLFQVSTKKLIKLFQSMDETICFAGHTHDLEIIGFDGENISRMPFEGNSVALEKKRQYIITVGSVGQPRDGNNNAKYVLWDTVDRTVEVRFVPYNISVTAQKILDLGFPEFNANRLW